MIAILALYFANNLTKKLAIEERKRVELISQAIESTAKSTDEQANIVESKLISENTTIPVIWTDDKANIIDMKNVDTKLLNKEEKEELLEEIKKSHTPISIQIIDGPPQFIYYGESALLKQLRFFPYVLLVILFLFLLIVATFISTSSRQIQDRVWVGMSKETAHQLGTPVSSLQGWVEMLKETNKEPDIVREMEKDVERLKLVSDRFGKIGSTPKLIRTYLVRQLVSMTDYMKRRAPEKVHFELSLNGLAQYEIPVSPQLFDWVIENLLKNALDAMEGEGRIHIALVDEKERAVIEVSDTGKGIPRSLWASIFKPGFTTKKRGWGLGLSLSKRIIDHYHKGNLFVRYSEPGKGTTFRIELNKSADV